MFDIYLKIVLNHIFSKLDYTEYLNKTETVKETLLTLRGSLLSTTEKISASGFGNYFGVSLNGKGTGYIAGTVVCIKVRTASFPRFWKNHP